MGAFGYLCDEVTSSRFITRPVVSAERFGNKRRAPKATDRGATRCWPAHLLGFSIRLLIAAGNS
jgi:hypothetical protein